LSALFHLSNYFLLCAFSPWGDTKDPVPLVDTEMSLHLLIDDVVPLLFLLGPLLTVHHHLGIDVPHLFVPLHRINAGEKTLTTDPPGIITCLFLSFWYLIFLVCVYVTEPGRSQLNTKLPVVVQLFEHELI